VRDEDRRHVHLVVQSAQPRAQVLADTCVERAERLVEEEHGRLDGQRPSEAHALPLAAGQLRRVVVRPARDLDELEQLVDPPANLRPRPAPHLEPEGDVLAHGHVLERRVMLEDEADPALLRRPLGHVDAVQLDRSRFRPLEASDHAQERRLPAPARPEERGQRAGRHLDRDVVESSERPEALRERAGDDGHQRVSSLGLNRLISTSVVIAISASTNDAA
jgi:hypothetical protein